MNSIAGGAGVSPTPVATSYADVAQRTAQSDVPPEEAVIVSRALLFFSTIWSAWMQASRWGTMAVVSAAALIPVTACEEKPQTPVADAATQGSAAGTQRMRVALASPGGRLPFFVDLPIGERDGFANIRNGEEAIPVAFTRTDDELTLDFPHFDSRLTLSKTSAGDYAGQWRRFGKEGVDETMDAGAIVAPDTPRFNGASATNTDYSGVWRMNFEQDGPAKGIFQQNTDGSLSGTILTPTGDYRFLAGDVVDGQLRLSVFDGAHAFLFHGVLDAADPNTMTGDFWSRMTWHDPFTAQRLPVGEDFDLPDPFSETTLVSSDKRLHLERLDDARYAGKAVIVQLFGTWCPNCHDEAPVLADFYQKYHDEGLEILSLAYEFGDDAARIDRQIARYRQRYGIDWEIVWSGPSKKEEASRTLPDLSAVKAYPTAIFLNRDHNVRAIHTGFAGPATGAEHTKLLREFDALIQAMLASPAPAS